MDWTEQFQMIIKGKPPISSHRPFKITALLPALLYFESFNSTRKETISLAFLE